MATQFSLLATITEILEEKKQQNDLFGNIYGYGPVSSLR